jgi:hypothetical protein
MGDVWDVDGFMKLMKKNTKQKFMMDLRSLSLSSLPLSLSSLSGAHAGIGEYAAA